MKNLEKSFNPTCWLLICFLFFSISESIAQVKKMSAKDLTEESTSVLYGKCTKIQSEWDETKSIIYTYVSIAPEAYIKGNLGSEAVIAVPGGQVDDIKYEVSEMPVFVEGEEAVVFIWTSPAGKNLVTGGYLGKMKIEKDAKTGKRMVHGSDISDEDESASPEIDKVDKPEKQATMLLDDFVTKLKGYAKN